MRGGWRAPGYLQCPVLVPETPRMPGSSAVPSILSSNWVSSNESVLLKLRLGFLPLSDPRVLIILIGSLLGKGAYGKGPPSVNEIVQ